MLYVIGQGVFYLQKCKKGDSGGAECESNGLAGAWELVYFKRIFCGRLLCKKKERDFGKEGVK
jgi:hypothetical protein